MREKVGGSSLALAQAGLMPDSSSVYEWCYDQQQQTWVPWMSTIPEFKCDPEKPFSEVREGFGLRACAACKRRSAVGGCLG